MGSYRHRVERGLIQLRLAFSCKAIGRIALLCVVANTKHGIYYILEKVSVYIQCLQKRLNVRTMWASFIYACSDLHQRRARG